MNYYNENDPSAAAWIMELMRQGAIPDGHIDTRSIDDVRSEDLAGFDQCHFFAGIGGWSHALELAGYANVRGLWTGSCPCQPFSAAGKQKGTSDARHLWPEMFRLVRECKPRYVLGEQVEAAVRLGWLDGVFGDLETEGYTTGAVVLGAHSVGAPHIRQRLYWGGSRMGNAVERTCERGTRGVLGAEAEVGCERTLDGDLPIGFEHAGEDVGGLEHAPRYGWSERRPEPGGRGAPVRCGEGGGGLGNPIKPRLEGHAGDVKDRNEPRRHGAEPIRSAWASSITIPCADGKTRRISPEPGVFPLAHGVPGRVGLLRGYGNAIVPQVAAEFITSFMETVSC